MPKKSNKRKRDHAPSHDELHQLRETEALFKSNLFHATDRGAFQDGYANRRINFTLLFGQRGLGCPGGEEQQPTAGVQSQRDEL